MINLMARGEDPRCPTIRLSKEEKLRLRNPWKKALIVKLFGRGMGYLQLKRGLAAKWALKGDFSIIDVGYDYYIVGFSNMDDYDHVMTQGPWLIRITISQYGSGFQTLSSMKNQSDT